MLKTTFVLAGIFLSAYVFSQHNLLGKSSEFIKGFYKYDPEYIVDIDTLNSQKILINCQTGNDYPYHTYEIDMLTDKCSSYGYVSNNKNVLKTYMEFLGFLGKVVKTDSIYSHTVYAVDLPKKTVYYSIKKPYPESNILPQKNIFYIVVTQEEKTINSVKNPEQYK